MTRAALKAALVDLPLFSDLSAQELELLVSTVRSLSVRKNTRVFEEGAAADCCYMLTSGRARVVVAGEGDGEIVLGTVRPRTLVGELALFDRAPRSASLVAVEPSHFIVIPAASFDALRRNPAFERRVVARVVATLRESTEHVRAVSAPSSLARLAWCLGRLARHEGEPDGRHVAIPRRTHQDLAEMIGCSRETVSRKLELMRRRKWVSWDRQTMRVDLSHLERLARGGPEPEV
jgi:CRP/FNR family cyclic AMP-dependent transcriptional regulator